MIPTRNLMIRLQERTNELYGAPSGSLPSRLGHFARWLETEPFFASTLASLPDPGIDADEWIQENIQWNQDIRFPEDEDATAASCWLVTRHVATQDNPTDAMFGMTHLFSDVRNMDDAQRMFLDTFLGPLLTWLKERILTDDHVLHSIQRYAHEAAWFRRDELRASYATDTGVGERTLDRDLRQHLFREGIDFPFSQAHGPSGIPDIVVPDDEAQPLPLEVKVFDPEKGRDKAHVRSGSFRRSSTPTTTGVPTRISESLTSRPTGCRFRATTRSAAFPTCGAAA